MGMPSSLEAHAVRPCQELWPSRTPRAVQATAVSLNGARRERRPQAVDEPRPAALVETGDVAAGRPDAPRERLPPVVEAVECPRHGQLGLLDVAQAGRPNSSTRWPRRAPASCDSSSTAGSSSRAAAQNGSAARAAGVVPDAGRDDAAGAGDARHLPKPGDRIGHEVDDELGERGVERGVGEGERLRRGALRRRRPGGGPSPPRRTARMDRPRRHGPPRAGPRARRSRAPGPHPTSRTRWPGSTPAKSANGPERRATSRP